MNKSELIEKLAERSSIPLPQAENIVSIVIEKMQETLANDGRIEIRGFGSFVARRYRARQGRNPRTGEAIPVKAKKLPVFKPGKDLKERIDHYARTARPEDGR